MPLKEPDVSQKPISFRIDELIKEIEDNCILLKEDSVYRNECLKELRQLHIDKAKYNIALTRKIADDTQTCKYFAKMFDEIMASNDIDKLMKFIEMKSSPNFDKIRTPQTEVL